MDASHLYFLPCIKKIQIIQANASYATENLLEE
jgi:hypothetical protein